MAGANASAIMRLPKPRDLTDKETADSLEHWITQFTVYIQRDTYMQPFLTRTWNSAAPNRGQAALNDIPAEDMSIYNTHFLKHIASFLPHPFFKDSVVNRTTDMESVWNLFREIYNVELCAETFLDLSTLAYKNTESYFTFYHRILYLIEQNLAPAGTQVNHITTGDTGDKLTISILDIAASWWLVKIDPRLPDLVKSAYSVQIKQGQRLSEMVPQISKAIPGMLQRMQGFKKDIVSCLKDLGLDEDATEDMNASIRRLDSRRQQNQQGRGGFKRGGGGNRSQQSGRQNRPLCRHCNWLRSYLKISEVDPYHSTEQCSRKMPDAVRSIIDQECPPDLNETDDEEPDDEESGERNKTKLRNIIRSFFQSEPPPEGQPPPKVAQDNKVREQIHHSQILSEENAHQIRVRAVTMANKATSPKLMVTVKGAKVPLLIDEGAEVNAMDGAFAKERNIELTGSSRSASGAGSQTLDILGETRDDFFVDTHFPNRRVAINMGKVTIIRNLGTPLILGEPGKAYNNISTDPKTRTIYLEKHGEKMAKPYLETDNQIAHICRIKEGPVTVFPEDNITFPVPDTFKGQHIVITPRRNYAHAFRPFVTQYSETVTLENISDLPINLRKSDQVADIRQASVAHPPDTNNTSVRLVHQHTTDDFKFKPTVKNPEPPDLDKISVDPDNRLTKETQNKFHSINRKYTELFTTTPGRYSGKFGDVDTSLRFNSPPVQTKKVCIPNYSPDMKDQLAAKMNELIQAGVLMTPEEVGVSAEFISPSMLVPKAEKNSFRLVTDFTHLNKFIKRDASVSPTIQEAKADLSRKKLFAELDLSNYFFQGGLQRADTAYLAVQHPFRGVHVYTASPQGLKNSSEQSYNRLARVYGDMMERGELTRMADGLYPLGNDEEELLRNYEETLRRGRLAGFTFKPSKVVIAPKSTVIFGWKLEDGLWSPQDHVISSLAKANFPTTIKQLRSYLGAVKQLAECVPAYGVLLSPFEKIVGSRASAERITWTDELRNSFEKIKKAIASPQGVHYPLQTDRLQTSSDFSKQHGAVGGLLTIIRKDGDKERKLLGGHFSATLTKDQCNWLPCEGESKAVQLVLQHFEHLIRENPNTTTHYCDNMPTVLAWRKLMTGQFSTSPRISTFLSTLAALPVRVEHRPGSALEIADHASRHASAPCQGKCEVCKYIADDVKVGNNCDALYSIMDETCYSIEDTTITPGKVPFLQLATWRNLQANDSVHAKLVNLINSGQEPERRRTGGEHTVVKHLHTLFTRDNLIIHKSGVVMVRAKHGHFDGFAISVPENLFPGLAFSFHNRLNHPSKGQLSKFLSRYFFVTALPTVVDKITSSCVKCLATMKLPKALIEDTTSIPTGFGTSFAADVIERNRQLIFVCKEIFSQFVTATLIEDQTTPSLRDALITMTSQLVSISGAEVRLDSAPGFQSLHKNQHNDPILQSLKLKIVLGEPLNVNKNPSGESTVAELKRELLNLVSASQELDPSTLAMAVRNLNNRVRAGGHTALETMTRRDLLTAHDLTLDDDQRRQDLVERRAAQHKSNRNSNLRTKTIVPKMDFAVGDVVMYRDMPNLNRQRDTFLVMDVTPDSVTIKKMSDQLREKTYTVKHEQLIKVFTSSGQLPVITTPAVTPPTDSATDQPVSVMDPVTDTVTNPVTVPVMSPVPVTDTVTATSKRRKKSSPAIATRPRSERVAAQKQRNLIHSKIVRKLVNITMSRKKKPRQDYVFLEIIQKRPPRLDDTYSDEDMGFGLFDSDPEEQHDDDNFPLYFDSPNNSLDDILPDNIEDNDDTNDVSSRHDDSDDSDPDTQNNAFHEFQPVSASDLSVCTMSGTSRATLHRQLHYPSTSGESLAWDSDERLVTWPDPVENIQLYSPSSSSSDNVFGPVRMCSTPISGRVTRQMVRSGEYELRSPHNVSPMIRNASIRRNVRPAFRRPLRVTFANSRENLNIATIEDDIDVHAASPARL